MNLGTFCPLEKHQQILTPIVPPLKVDPCVAMYDACKRK
jgi:hypothetical protein